MATYGLEGEIKKFSITNSGVNAGITIYTCPADRAAFVMYANFDGIGAPGLEKNHIKSLQGGPTASVATVINDLPKSSLFNFDPTGVSHSDRCLSEDDTITFASNNAGSNAEAIVYVFEYL